MTLLGLTPVRHTAKHHPSAETAADRCGLGVPMQSREGEVWMPLPGRGG